MPTIHLSQEGSTTGAHGQYLICAEVTLDDERTHTGFGRDADQQIAQDKAISEAIERLAFRTLPDTQWATAAQMPSRIEPDALVRYLPEQYADPSFCIAAFREDVPYHWVAMRDVMDNSITYALADFVCSPAAFTPTYLSQLVTHATSSGCASGPDLNTCIERAVLELVERDAFMRHWFAQQPGRSIDRNTLPDDLRERVEHLEHLGAASGVQCLHLGHHPTWMVWVQREAAHFTTVGSACSFDAEGALRNAFAEAEALALAHMDAPLDHAIEPANVRTPADHRTLYATPAYFRQADRLWADSGDSAPYAKAAATFRGDAATLFNRLGTAGHRPCWTELAPPGGTPVIGDRAIHTVRALAPGLIPISFGYRREPLGMDCWRQAVPGAIHPFA
ncbi:YcaO-like family protein [Ralstonia flaminis]|jgi:ribosomal protein S12 methylthiotransferase accessory factor|uniref:YcaO domain-containing protein n=1 Tax=Ralstonia flaminis TaxID=3058597 RepID=A0ABM9K916_9RALS|nr:YcaO-like family protein [Ralstonia sp. LMG 18101]CAJ0817789.1 hypothetical protein LMG18101_03389 [Ralstonia sp. LMG 18101]